MPSLLSIRVAEPWTAMSVVVLIAIAIALIGLTVSLIHRA